MKKLVLLIKHKRSVGVFVPGRGVLYPSASMEPNGTVYVDREAWGLAYDWDHISTINLLPEEPDPMPPGITSDPDLIREFKISQARSVSDNIKANEALINSLRSHEDAGNITILGRAQLDSKGKPILTKVEPEIPIPVIAESKEEEPLTVASEARTPRKKKATSE